MNRIRRLRRFLACKNRTQRMLRWLLMTFVYGTVVVVNEHFEWIQALSLHPVVETLFRLMGLYFYIFLTRISFQGASGRGPGKEDKDTEEPPFIK